MLVHPSRSEYPSTLCMFCFTVLLGVELIYIKTSVLDQARVCVGGCVWGGGRAQYKCTFLFKQLGKLNTQRLLSAFVVFEASLKKKKRKHSEINVVNNMITTLYCFLGMQADLGDKSNPAHRPCVADTVYNIL